MIAATSSAGSNGRVALAVSRISESASADRIIRIPSYSRGSGATAPWATSSRTS